MIAYVEGARCHFKPILHLSGTSVILNCYMFFQNNQACTCICTSMWGGCFLTFVVTVVNMRNVFYYELSEYAQLILYKWCGQLTIKFLT